MRRLSRRHFLRRGAGAGLTLAGSKFLTGCVPGGAPPSFIAQPADVPVADRAEVSAVRGTDLYEMTRQTLEAVGGIDVIVHPGETVFIKPNFGAYGWLWLDTFATGEDVKPEIVIVVAEECLKAGAAKVIIGEGSQKPEFPWDRATTFDGSTNLAAEAQRLNATYPGEVVLACLQVDSPTWDGLPSPHTDLDAIYVSSLVARADRVISLAVIKTHRWTHITGALKNFVGVASLEHHDPGNTGGRTGLHTAAGGVGQCFVDICASLKPDLAIIDGSICVEGNGPNVAGGWWGKTIDVSDTLGDWFMLGSTDLVAADATAARIIGCDVDQIDHLQKAYNQGVGQIREDMIDVTGATIDELRVDFEPAEVVAGLDEIMLQGLILQLMSMTTQTYPRW